MKIILTTIMVMSFAVSITILVAQGSGSDDYKKPVTTVSSVDLDKYAGKWFEIARYPNRFQKKCAGEVTATYTLKGDKKVEVLNECAKENGETTKALGEAKIVDDKTNAKLKVRFAPGWLSWLPFVWGDYWILDLDENYQYAVVGSPDRDYLWILSREASLGDETYSRLLKKVEEMGFDPNKLVKTRQK